MKITWYWTPRKKLEEANEKIRQLEIELQRKELYRAAAVKLHEEDKEQWFNKWEPLLNRMSALKVTHTPGGFAIQVLLDRNMMEHIAMHNDAGFWSYIAKDLAGLFERQLATLNFSGLHKLANDTNSRLRRHPTMRRNGVDHED